MTNANPLVLGVVVTYRPVRDTLQRLLMALSPQVAEVLVVDNTPQEDDHAWQFILPLMPMLTNLRLVRLGENRGIAAALNVGIDCALKEGFCFALLSDQDSLPENGMVGILREVALELQAKGNRVASVCPQYFDQTTQVTAPFQVQIPGRVFYSSVSGKNATPWIEIVTSITSGSLLTRPAMQEVGGMREELFIDHVDTEWSHRSRSLGYTNYGTARTRLVQELGDERFAMWYFGWHPCSLYSPLRLYYRFRNFVLLWHLRHVPKLWLMRATWYWLGNFYAHAIFSPTRVLNIRMMLLGLWHGVCRRDGKFEEPRSEAESACSRN